MFRKFEITLKYETQQNETTTLWYTKNRRVIICVILLQYNTRTSFKEGDSFSLKLVCKYSTIKIH